MRPFLALLIIAGLLTNEAIGPWILGAGIAGWGLFTILYLDSALKAVRDCGWLVWSVPLIALASVAWSDEPAISFRGAIETLAMVWCIALIAEYIPPRAYMLLLWGTLAIIALLSVAFNNESWDGMLRRSNMTGIFENKNTFSTCSGVLVLLSGAIALDKRLPAIMRLGAIPYIGLGLFQSLYANSVASSAALGAAMFGGLVLFTVPWVRPSHRKSYVYGLVLVGFIAVFVVGIGVTMFEDELLALVNKDPTLTGRTELWAFADKFIAEHSLMGVGYNAFWVRGHQIAEYLWHANNVDSGDGFHFHNLYYELMVELGAAGVFFGACFIGVAFGRMVRWLHMDPTPESVFFFTLLAYILIIQVQGYNLFATFDPTYGETVALAIYGRNWMYWRKFAELQQAQPGMTPAAA